MNPKEMAGRRAAEFVEDGMVVGLGTGSTAFFAIQSIGEKVAAGLRIHAIPTSLASARQAEALSIPLIGLEDCDSIDLTIDGADEVAPNFDLIKGLGGALLREKVVAAATTQQIIIVDPSKLVERLGTRAPLPVEVLPFAVAPVRRRLEALGCRAALRLADDGGPLVTDNGNHILDCHFATGIPDPGRLEAQIDRIPGVAGNGLFVGLTHRVIVGEESGCRLLDPA